MKRWRYPGMWVPGGVVVGLVGGMRRRERGIWRARAGTTSIINREWLDHAYKRNERHIYFERVIIISNRAAADDLHILSHCCTCADRQLFTQVLMITTCALFVLYANSPVCSRVSHILIPAWIVDSPNPSVSHLSLGLSFRIRFVYSRWSLAWYSFITDGKSYRRCMYVTRNSLKGWLNNTNRPFRNN